jgi:hypothetical protein
MDKQIERGLKTLFLVSFIIALFSGVMHLFLPRALGSMEGWPVRDVPAWRLIGAAMVSLAASSWLCFRATGWEKVKIVVQTDIVFSVVAGLVMLWGLLFREIPVGGWGDFVIFVGFAASFVVFYWRSRA